jgi:hypothetical protein
MFNKRIIIAIVCLTNNQKRDESQRLGEIISSGGWFFDTFKVVFFSKILFQISSLILQ